MIRLVGEFKFSSTFLLIQLPGKTNDRVRLCEHISQTPVNCSHICSFIPFCILYDVVKHWHEDDPTFQELWFTLKNCH